MNQIQRAMRDGIRVEGGGRLGWCAYDDLLGCYHNKHNNAREAIKWARHCRKVTLQTNPPIWVASFNALLAQRQEDYDRVHPRDTAAVPPAR
jgi:hypothetical protein